MVPPSLRSIPYLGVGCEGLAQRGPERLLHDPLHLQQPVLHVAPWVQLLREVHVLSVSRVHLSDTQVILKLELQANNDRSEIGIWVRDGVLGQGLCCGSVIVFWVSYCVLGQLLCCGSVIVLWVRDWDLGQRLESGSVIVFWVSDCVLGQGLCCGSVIVFWVNDCVVGQ